MRYTRTMEIAIIKGERHDRIIAIRREGTRIETTFPHKGPVPHDAVHLIVERELGLRYGFWGLVAAGRDPETLVELAKAGGHASAKRAGDPDPAIVELVQAERLVECFEAELWSGGEDDAGLLAMAEAGCSTSRVPLPDLPVGALGRARAALREFANAWIRAPLGHVSGHKWEE